VWCEAKQVRRRNDDTLCSGNNGSKAREEVTKVLRRFGCESIGFMDDFEKHEVLLAFTQRGRQVQLHASAKGWALMYLKENPWTYSRRSQRVEYEQAPLRQGHIAHLHLTRCHEKTRLWSTPSGLPLSHSLIYLAAAPLCCARRSRNRSCRWREMLATVAKPYGVHISIVSRL
jgi:hypothetical protein